MISPTSKQNIKQLLNRILYGVLPGRCILCFENTYRMFDLCQECQADLPRFAYPCWQCGLPMPADREVCEDCERVPPPYSHCYTAFQYQAPIDKLIIQFKTSGKIIIGKVLAQILAQSYAARHLSYPDIWIPVPLHKEKLTQRGFNQAYEIAQVLEDVMNIPVRDNICERVKNTADQKRLTLKERIKNIDAAFYVNQLVSGKSIGLVDDVVTSGATMAELSRRLLDAGAREVQVLCLARTTKKI